MRKMTEYRIADGSREVSVRIIRSGRKSLGLEVRSGGEVMARVPQSVPDGEVIKFIEKHRGWILRKLSAQSGRDIQREDTGATPVSSLTDEEMERIKEKIAGRVVHYARLMGVTFGRITIRNQKTRWGSCSSRGNLNFNYQLYYLPDELLDYVVVHELAHRRHMNHSREFWKEVEQWYPGYQEARRKLKGIRLSE